MFYDKNSFESYIAHISGYPRIDTTREAELSSIIIKSRNAEKIEEAVNELVLANLRLVLHCLKDYQSFLSSSEICLSEMDLIAEGNIALMAAARGFDAGFSRSSDQDSQARFGTYACRCIRSRMQRAIKLSRLVHIPERHFTYKKKLDEIESRNGSVLSEEQISKEIGIRRERLEMVRWSSTCKTTRLEDMNTGDSSQMSIENLPDTRQTAPDESTERNDMLRLVQDKMKHLKPRTRRMLERMFLSGDKTTLQDLSEEFNVSKERCRQITQAGLKQIRDLISMETQEDSGRHKAAKLKWPPDLSLRKGPAGAGWIKTHRSLSEVA